MTEGGFAASPTDPHYAGVWARDAAVACLGAAVSEDPRLVEAAEVTLRALAGRASEVGQIPNAYWPARGYWDWGEAGATDATAWFVVALAHHGLTTGRFDVVRELWPAALAALGWLRSQDVTGTGLVDSPAGGDWMDSSLNRRGRVFHVNVLANWACRLTASIAEVLGEPSVPVVPNAAAIEGLFWPRPGADLAELHRASYPEGAHPSFPHPMAARLHAAHAIADRRHYVAAVSYGHVVDRCDVLAHCLAICSGLVSGERAGIVLGHLADTGSDLPYPSRAWPQPFRPDEDDTLLDRLADDRQDPRWRNPPGAYHNGAAWPYIGAFHAVAEHRAGRRERAAELLAAVAVANRLGDPPWGFHEWIASPGGVPSGARDQVWNAGAFLWAYASTAG